MFFVYNALQLLEALAEHIDIDIWEGKNKAISRAYKYRYMREGKKYLFVFISWY